MKKLTLLIVILISTSFYVNAQSRIPSAEEKQAINPIVDREFKVWSDEDWSWDTYVRRSAKITTISIDEDYGDIAVTGNFSYKRLGGTQSGTFYASFSISEGYMKIVKLNYTDAGGIRDSRRF